MPLLTGPAPTYNVELLLDQSPNISTDALVASFRRYCGNIEVVSSNENSGFTFAMPDYAVDFDGKLVPPLIAVMVAEKSATSEQMQAALHQSRQMPQAHAVVANHRHSVLVTDIMASRLHYKRRLQLFSRALTAVLEVVPCQGIHWLASQQIISPEKYLENQRGLEPNQLYGAVNIRMFRIENRRPNEVLMDSMGLVAFGLPDVQCHFVDLDPNEVAVVLYNAAKYLFENGDIINDGQTFGMTVEQKWRCQHEESLVEPKREVLDIDPGPPYAAGTRRN